MKDKKLKKSKSLKLMNLHLQESTKSICMNSKKKLFLSDIAGTLISFISNFKYFALNKKNKLDSNLLIYFFI